MALLLTNQSKRKSRGSSSSQTSSISSPESKKIKEAEKIGEQVIVEQEDEVMAALSIAEDFTVKLDRILSKVENLDKISKSVSKIEDSLHKLEDRMIALEEFKVEATSKFSEIIDGSKHYEICTDKKIQETKEGLQKAKENVIKLEDEHKELKTRVKEMEDEIESLKSKDLYLEAYSRRENIIFRNIAETPWEDNEKTLRSFLQEKLKYDDYDSVEMQRVHRNPSRDKTKPRPIIARFLRFKDCQKILSLGKELKGTDYSMYTDLPLEIVRRRKPLIATLKKAKANNIPAAFSKAKPDKLYVRGEEWSVGQELKV